MKRILEDGRIICRVCGQTLPREAFYESMIARSAYTCKDCACARTKAWNLKNPERTRARHEAWHALNRDRVRANQRAWSAANRDQVRASKQAWSAANRDQVCANKRARYAANRNRRRAEARAYYAENLEQNRANKRNYVRRRVAEDFGFRMLVCLRARMRCALNGKMKAGRTMELVGCSRDYLLSHIECQFCPGMSWDNYGEWEIDHTVPCASFDLTDPEQQKICFHWTNLRPLWKSDNRSKGATTCPQDF